MTQAEVHHEQCPWARADVERIRSVCGCPPGWPKQTVAPPPGATQAQRETLEVVAVIERRMAANDERDCLMVLERVLPLLQAYVRLQQELDEVRTVADDLRSALCRKTFGI